MLSGLYDDQRLELCRRIMKELVSLYLMNGSPISVTSNTRGLYEALAWRDEDTGKDRFEVSFDAHVKIKVNSVDEYVDEIVCYRCETYTVFLAVMELCEDLLKIIGINSFSEAAYREVKNRRGLSVNLFGKYSVVFEKLRDDAPTLIDATFYYDKYHIAIPVLSTFPFLPLIDIMLGMECLP